MVDWPIFVLGLVAISIVATAVRAIAREDQVAREARTANTVSTTPPGERRA